MKGPSIELTDQWEPFVDRLKKMKGDFVNFCIEAATMKEKKYYQGKIHMIDEVLALPKQIWTEE